MKLGKKKKPTVEQMPENVTPLPLSEPEHAPEPEEDFGAPTLEEQNAMQDSDDRDDEPSDTTARLDSTVKYVLDSFNLDNRGFVVKAFADKGKKGVMASLVNADFDVTVVVKDPAKYNII